jgi:hypothetical protein
MLHRIRESLKEKNSALLAGTVTKKHYWKKWQ